MASSGQIPDRQITLYHFQSSYFSQMARLAFVEKHIAYVSKIVNILQGETYAPDFVAISPACEVPAITISNGDSITAISGSQEIIDYLDSITTDPDPFYNQQKEQINAFRQRCVDLPMAEITLGIVRHPHLLEGTKIPQNVIDNFSRRVDRKQLMIDNIQRYPHLAHFYQTKLQRVIEVENNSDENTLRELLADLDTFLDQVNAQLRTAARMHGDHDGKHYDGWLFGRNFSNADIALATLLARLDLLGRAGHFWDMTERVFLADYYRRLKERPSFQQECVTNMS
ncbi:uncharacterized protein LOC129602837 [Paramacrobiotus metropolitanus]|uniref:uncharacterized protein LOC129602837 n=1 Tax=Paramacrobiotus metropolitanus TaxID=2943436 RepID=UPI002445AE95|nr:uncharacterized protein LOC129602837 [Paramacrobiotus metropolitanus]